MADITFKGNAIKTNGDLPKVGSKAPAFTLTTTSLEDVGLDAFKGKKKVLTINPSLDTGICQATARAFNEKASKLDNTVILVVTSDLPFAAKRFCEAEGLTNVHPLTMMRDRKFADTYGLKMESGPLAGLVARAVLVLDETDTIVHAELVPEIVQEPNYDAALAALKQ
jgi:thiol peroxidase